MAMDLKTAPVTLRFGDDTQQDEFKLFELDDTILAEIQASTARGHDLVEIRGPANKDAVLVTANRSYSVKLVETSNTLMLVADQHAAANVKQALAATTGSQSSQSSSQPSQSQSNGIKKARLDMDGTAKASEVKTEGNASDRVIVGTVSCHYELVEIMPRVAELRELLSSSIWEWNSDDEAIAHEAKQAASGAGAVKFYTTKELQLAIQASNTQLFAALDYEEAFLLRGVWRRVSFVVMAICMKNFNLIFAANDTWRHEIPGQVYLEEMRSLAEYPDEVYIHFLRCITERKDNDARFNVAEASLLSYTIDPKKWARYHAEALFRLLNPIAYQEFLTEWQTLCDWITPDIAWLKGFAIVEDNIALQYDDGSNNGGGVDNGEEKGKRDIRQWRYFDVRHMPYDAGARFAELFRLRPQWTKDDILPYIQGLSLQSNDELLLKNTRMIRKGDGFVYIRR